MSYIVGKGIDVLEQLPVATLQPVYFGNEKLEREVLIKALRMLYDYDIINENEFIRFKIRATTCKLKGVIV